MKFHVIPRERSDRGNPFSCDAKHRAAFWRQGGTDCHVVEAQATMLHFPQSGKFHLCLGFSSPHKGQLPLRGPRFGRSSQ